MKTVHPSTHTVLKPRRRPSLRERMADWVGTFSAEDEATLTSLGAEFLCAFALPATYALYGLPERLSVGTAWPLTVGLYLVAFVIFRSAAVMAIRKTDEDGDEVIVFPTPPAVVGAVPVHDLLFWEASDRARYPRRDTLGLSVARLVLQALGAIMAYGWFVVKRDDGGLAEAGLMVSWRALRVKEWSFYYTLCVQILVGSAVSAMTLVQQQTRPGTKGYKQGMLWDALRTGIPIAILFLHPWAWISFSPTSFFWVRQAYGESTMVLLIVMFCSTTVQALLGHLWCELLYFERAKVTETDVQRLKNRSSD